MSAIKANFLTLGGLDGVPSAFTRFVDVAVEDEGELGSF